MPSGSPANADYNIISGFLCATDLAQTGCWCTLVHSMLNPVTTLLSKLAKPASSMEATEQNMLLERQTCVINAGTYLYSLYWALLNNFRILLISGLKFPALSCLKNSEIGLPNLKFSPVNNLCKVCSFSPRSFSGNEGKKFWKNGTQINKSI